MKSSYYTRAVGGEPDIIGKRPIMEVCYTEDVSSASRLFNIGDIRTHLSITEQENFKTPTSGGSSILRILQWNINSLFGPNSKSPQGKTYTCK
jgi:hypothetical protein